MSSTPPPPYYSTREANADRDTILPPSSSFSSRFGFPTASSNNTSSSSSSIPRLFIAVAELALLFFFGLAPWFLSLWLTGGTPLILILCFCGAILPVAYLHRNDLRRKWWGVLWVGCFLLFTLAWGADWAYRGRGTMVEVVFKGSVPLSSLITAAVAVGYKVFDPRGVGEEVIVLGREGGVAI